MIERKEKNITDKGLFSPKSEIKQRAFDLNTKKMHELIRRVRASLYLKKFTQPDQVMMQKIIAEQIAAEQKCIELIGDCDIKDINVNKLNKNNKVLQKLEGEREDYITSLQQQDVELKRLKLERKEFLSRKLVRAAYERYNSGHVWFGGTHRITFKNVPYDDVKLSDADWANESRRPADNFYQVFYNYRSNSRPDASVELLIEYWKTNEAKKKAAIKDQQIREVNQIIARNENKLSNIEHRINQIKNRQQLIEPVLEEQNRKDAVRANALKSVHQNMIHYLTALQREQALSATKRSVSLGKDWAELNDIVKNILSNVAHFRRSDQMRFLLKQYQNLINQFLNECNDNECKFDVELAKQQLRVINVYFDGKPFILDDRPQDYFASTLNFDLNELQARILEANKHIGLITSNSDTVFIMGPTKAGKSTLTSFLLGHDLEIREIKSKNGKKFTVLPKNYESLLEQKKIPSIGISAKSETLFPSTYDIKDEKLTLCDCGGFWDNGSPERDIAIVTSFKKLFAKTRQLKGMIFVIEAGVVKAQGGALLDNVITLLNQQLGENFPKEMFDSILFVITKAERDDHDAFLQTMKEKEEMLKESIADLKRKLGRQDNIELKSELRRKQQEELVWAALVRNEGASFHVLDSNDAEQRQKIFEKINKLAPLQHGMLLFDRNDEVYNHYIDTCQQNIFQYLYLHNRIIADLELFKQCKINNENLAETIKETEFLLRAAVLGYGFAKSKRILEEKTTDDQVNLDEYFYKEQAEKYYYLLWVKKQEYYKIYKTMCRMVDTMCQLKEIMDKFNVPFFNFIKNVAKQSIYYTDIELTNNFIEAFEQKIEPDKLDVTFRRFDSSQRRELYRAAKIDNHDDANARRQKNIMAFNDFKHEVKEYCTRSTNQNFKNDIGNAIDMLEQGAVSNRLMRKVSGSGEMGFFNNFLSTPTVNARVLSKNKLSL